MADKLDHFMWSRYGEITVISKLNVLQEPTNQDEIRLLLNELKTSFPSFSWVGFTNSNGTVMASTDDILVGKSISERPVFTEAKEQTFIGDVHDAVLLSKLLPNPTGEPLQFVDISSPIMTKDGVFVGVLAAHLSWEWAEEVKRSVIQPLEEKNNQKEILIISKRENTVLLGPKNLIGKKLELPAIQQAQSGKNGWSIEEWEDGKQYLTGYALADGLLNYPGLDWTVLVRQPKEVAFFSVAELKEYILLVGFLSTILFAIISWFLAGIISNPLKQISLTAERLRKGEKVEIPYTKGIRDIEVLSNSLRDLLSTLVKTESALNKMEILAQKDKLTDLPNRLALEQYLNSYTSTDLEEAGDSLTFLFLDLDGFKQVNDKFGHDLGDRLLKEVANRLQSSLRRKEFVCRLGGDEFVIVIVSTATSALENGTLVGKRIIQSLNKSFELEKKIINIGCSVGGSVWPQDDTDPYQVLRNADKALYDSKRNGKNELTFFHN
ncbi:sensor domain-containing diguanylate cyclase [Bacillus sp. DJP31]|uniref:sensor domain-containing diguanylate cyclase n=1 Tax=Bacillus sp. DJP31 TaxID=3409789 RepID=UPI003BB688B1